MTRRGQITLAAVVAIGALVCFEVYSRKTSPQSSDASQQLATGPNGVVSVKATALHGSAGSAQLPVAEESVAAGATSALPTAKPAVPAAVAQVADTPESSSLPPATVLENMRTTIRQFGSTIGENPVGTNPEITSALQGNNPKHIDFLKADGNRINANGELVDVWGTPYFFHQLSAHEMEIRSAGPDRVMFTTDDLVIR